MSRRGPAVKRDILPDPLFEDVLLASFINHLMCDGKKAVAEKIVYRALDLVHSRIVTDRLPEKTIYNSKEAREKVLELFNKALESIKPTSEVKSRRIGGATYQVPVDLSSSRRVTLAMRWLIDCAKKRSKRAMFLKLADEIMDALNETGGAVKRRIDMHKMAKANQAFAHYR